MQCSQAPVDAADAQVFSEVVFEFVSSLLRESVCQQAVDACGRGRRSYRV